MRCFSFKTYKIPFMFVSRIIAKNERRDKNSYSPLNIRLPLLSNCESNNVPRILPPFRINKRKSQCYERSMLAFRREVVSPFKGSWGHIKVDLALRNPFSSCLRTLKKWNRVDFCKQVQPSITMGSLKVAVKPPCTYKTYNKSIRN